MLVWCVHNVILKVCERKLNLNAHHIIKDINPERGCHQQPLLLPQLSLGSHQPGAQYGQEGVEGEVQVLHVVALIRLKHPLQPFR